MAKFFIKNFEKFGGKEVYLYDPWNNALVPDVGHG